MAQIDFLYPYITNLIVVTIVAVLFLPAQYWQRHPLYSLVEWLERYAYKIHTKFLEAPQTSIVRIVLFDDDFFQNNKVRKSPLDRKCLADLLEKLIEIEPKVVAIDIDIYYQLKPAFEDKLSVYPFSNDLLNRLEKDDNDLLRAIKKLIEKKIYVILPLTEPGINNFKKMSYDLKSNYLCFGYPLANIDDIDGKIYELPIWMERQNLTANLERFRQESNPSFALATWAAYHNLSSDYFLSKQVPSTTKQAIKETISYFESRKTVLINYGYRISSDGKNIPAFNNKSATNFLPKEKLIDERLKQDWRNKIILIGRNSYLQDPIVERKDSYSIPFQNKNLSGVFLQGIFIDNLMNRVWIGKMTWYKGEALGTLLSIFIGWGIIFISQLNTINPVALINDFLSDPLLALGFSIVISIVVTLIVNFVVLRKKGIYTVSFALIPLTSYLQAIIPYFLK